MFRSLPNPEDIIKEIKEKFDEILPIDRTDRLNEEGDPASHGHGEPSSVVPESGEDSSNDSWKVPKKWAIAAAVALFVLSGCSSAYFFSDSGKLADPGQKIYVQVKPGATAKTIAAELEERGVIGNRNKFYFTAKFRGEENSFKTGTYLFHGSMRDEDVIEKLAMGETTTVQFTIPEGFGVKDIAKRLSKEGIVEENDFLEKAKNFAPYDYMEKHRDAWYSAEGFLFPDTYTIGTDADSDSIQKMMAGNFDERLTEEMRERAEEQNLSIYELVTLASLVEKEARYEEDRPIIAQVFFKRLEIGMPLQTDATLQYLMDAPKEDVSIEDTKMDSPYNTYQNAGLPPGPIASPGMAAIEAVLHPADTDYLYFVADREGHNYYSYSYAEHLEQVERVR